MNSLDLPDHDRGRVFFRSLATRGAHELPESLPVVIDVLKAAGYDLVIVETPGIGQGDAAIVPFVDTAMYVMTPEFGAASQLEKIDMLDFADVVAINKFERRGAADALRDVGRQLVRNREAFGKQPADMPVYGTSAARFNDDGVTALYQHLRSLLAEEGLPVDEGTLPAVDTKVSTGIHPAIPGERVRYLAEIAATVRDYHATTDVLVEQARRVQRLEAVAAELEERGGSGFETVASATSSTTAGERGGNGFETVASATSSTTVEVEEVGHDRHETPAALVRRLAAEARDDLPREVRDQLEGWAGVVESYSGEEQVTVVRDKEIVTTLTRESLSGNKIRKVALPRYEDHGELVRFWRRENLPGYFPFTAGVFPFKRDGEDPARMFAGEGDPFRTNRRFKLLSHEGEATRLSTAFDSVTLYGRDPDERPDIYGKIGTSGVSVATLDDMKALYDGFDLLDPSTSVSMTINGPAPTVLAFFLNTVLDQARENGVDEATALATVRGTVQADILKEDQGQNTCLFSTEFSLRMMADIQEWFIERSVRNFYSVSISGYHIAEAGANPISQLAFTLANGFTYVESYLARGLDIDDFAPNLSFFFSNGMDPEYSVIGRVARRIWAVAMRDRYGANERSQKLKYHVQTSGRSLHAQEMDFNDIRTTLQALIAINDNANSLHTNAYDEAVTTPTEESVRRALAIQMIINREWGLSMNENQLQGSLHHRRAHRPGRGRGAAGVRGAQRARRRPRRDGDRLPARPHPGRVDALRAPQARRDAAHHRRQHLPAPRPRVRRRHPGPRRARPRHRGGEVLPAHAGARVPGRPPRRGRGRPRAAQAGRHGRGERVRRADGRRPRLLARPGHRGVLRGGRAVPPQRLTALPTTSHGGRGAATEVRGSGLETPQRDDVARRHGGRGAATEVRGSGLETPQRDDATREAGDPAEVSRRSPARPPQPPWGARTPWWPRARPTRARRARRGLDLALESGAGLVEDLAELAALLAEAGRG